MNACRTVNGCSNVLSKCIVKGPFLDEPPPSDAVMPGAVAYSTIEPAGAVIADASGKGSGSGYALLLEDAPPLG